MSIKKRTRIYVASITAICLAAYLIFSAIWLRFEYIGYTREASETVIGTLQLSFGSVSGNLDLFARELAQTMPENSAIVFFGNDGEVLGSSTGAALTDTKLLSRNEVREALRDSKGEDIRYSPVMKRELLYSARRLSDDVLIRIAMPFNSVGAYIWGLLPAFILTGACIFLLVSLLLERFASKLTAPYPHMTQMLEAAISPDTKPSVPESLKELQRYSELQPFIGNYERLLKRLDSYITEIEDKAEKIDHIIACMHEGLFMLDTNMELLLCNNTALDFLGLKSAGTEKSFARLCRIPELTDAVRLVLATSGSRSLDITRNMPDTRKYRVNITTAVWDASVRGVIILISDITSWARYDQLRSEFVANVSHELKTPITTIRGFAELLYSDMQNDPEQIKRYIKSIMSQSERLVNLVDDLLSLSALEHGVSRTKAPVRVDLRLTADEVIAALSDRIKERKINVTVEGEGTVMAQEIHISELAFNLIENAVKYNNPGGKINVRIWQDDKETGITVADTGIGIPQMHQGRIFERFYRVDKGRSSKTGGTGLGLSIVKHIAEQYGGSAQLSSIPGEGTAITVTFPAAVR